MGVLEVVSKPGEVAKMHHHPDHVLYVLKGGKASLTSGDKTILVFIVSSLLI
jgi:quercetin dioxygenase-like cupin family protein